MNPPDDVQLSCKYRPIAEIGRGGMGEVYLTVAHGVAGFKKLVVLKRARPDVAEEPGCVAMFLDEARLAARLNHPNVVQIYEAGQNAGRYFIEMEYLDGQPLHRIRDRIEPRWFPLSMQIRILIEALAGLHYAHELVDFDGTPLGVIHRDATPQNVFVTYDGQIKIVDFGIAKVASSTRRTDSGIVRGKVRYMAPEQARCEQIDRRVDIFAVGVMLWEAITGTRMWDGMSDAEIIRRLAMGKLPSLEAGAPNSDPELKRICGRALANMPARRFATAAELQHELERWLVRQGEEVPARVVGKFVAAHFEEERAAMKTRLEDYCSSSSLPKGMSIKQSTREFEQPTGESRSPRRRPMASSSESAVTVITPREGSQLAQAVAMAQKDFPCAAVATTVRERSPLEVSATMRSPTSVDTPLTAPISTCSSRRGLASVRALDRGPSSSTPASDEQATLPRVPVNMPPIVASLSAPRPQRQRWLSTIRVAGLIAAAAAASALTARVSLLWIDGQPMLPPGTTASVKALVSEGSALAANAPAEVGELDLTVRISPATARIFLDGVPVSAGLYKDKLAKDSRVHRIRAEAPNFAPMEQWIVASSDVIVNMALERESARAR
jgi:serine/threonine-protein kinase